MTLAAFVSFKGSPGVTTTAHAVGVVWPEEVDAVVAECDPAGGDIAMRLGLPLEPGLASLAAAGRRGISPDVLGVHTRRLGRRFGLLAGPAWDEEASAALTGVGADLASTLARSAAVVLADCGRLNRGSPAAPFVRHAVVTVVVVRPTIEATEHARVRLDGLRSLTGRVVLLVMGERPYPPAEVATTLGLPLVGVMADDPAGASALGRGDTGRRLERSPLLRSARVVAENLARRLAGSVAAEPPLSSDLAAEAVGA